MKANTIQTAAAALLLALQPCAATSSHRHHHNLGRRHSEAHDKNNSARGTDAVDAVVEDRSTGTCSFPTGQGLVAITPGSDNAGWAMSPDQPCKCGSYCPYACPPGQVMAQWQDGSTYATTERMNGGLFCNSNGQWSKPFSSKPFCVDGTGTVSAVNKAGKVCSFCQTVLPGNEDILIPTDVTDTQTLAVPDTSYWDGTSAHYYINAPGVNADTGCHWGDESKPIGNWAPYVAGMNTDASGLTYVKLGINPIWQGSALYSTKPTFALKIECNGNCVGLPCAIDGNGVTSDLKATGAGGSDFCVVTVPKGASANIVVYNLDGSTGSVASSSSSSTTTAKPTTSSTPPTSTSVKPTTSNIPTTSSVPSTSSTVASTTSLVPSSTTVSTSSSASSTVSIHLLGGIFQENGTSSSSYTWSAGPTATSVPADKTSNEGAAATSAESSKNESCGPNQGNAATAGLIIALIAAAHIL